MKCGLKIAICVLLITISGCGRHSEDMTANPAAEEQTDLKEPETMSADDLVISPDTDDFRTSYEIFVGSFYDSDKDGIGDLNGIRQKLDYICSEDGLGCTQIWLMPVFASPTYHKYDTTDYLSIDPQYGTMEDMEQLLSDCHARGVRILLDLPLNHTSLEHPWFTAAAEYLRGLPEGEEPSSQSCPYVDYYCFQKEKSAGYNQLSGTDWYYECRFWEGMPDLNLDDSKVRREIEDILSFWTKKGVDGFRLDAVTSYYTDSNDENIAFLTWLKQTAENIRPGTSFVGEAWVDQSVYADYYRSGIDSFFDFAMAGQDGVIANVVRGTRPASAYGRALMSGEELFEKANPEYINAPFYTNHDMARGAGYYAYDDGSRTKLAMALNLLSPGDAFLYYGEELGMKGSGKDENKRAPMYWTASAQAEGMCAGPPDMDSFKMKFAPLDEQLKDPFSVFHYVRNAIRIRRAFPVIARGKTILLEELSGDDLCVLQREMRNELPEREMQLQADQEDSDQQPEQATQGKNDDAKGRKTVWIVISTSEEEKTINLPLEQSRLCAALTVDEQMVKLENGQLYLPPFAVAILEKP